MQSISHGINDALLSNSPLGPLGLFAVASAVVIPLTLYRQGYAFSVGYGFSVAAMALYMMNLFNASSNSLVMSAAFYGLRLGSYLLFREWSSKEKAEQIKSFDKSPSLKRIPFAASVSLFYGFMMTPVLYVLRGATMDQNNIILNIGTIMSWTGAILEAVADYQKSYVKQKNKGQKKFVGPDDGVYSITRHPNYTGEVLFWLGVFVSGVPFFGKGSSVTNTVVGWLCSTLGFFGIYSIMTGASKRLDNKQAENYKGDPSYDAWRSRVKAPIFPFVNEE